MRTLVSIALASTALLLLAGPVVAQDPTSGAIREYSPGSTLTYRFGGTGYPSWIQSAIQAAIGPDWRSPAYNNTRLPSFTYSANGSGIVTYSSSPSSPCGTGNTAWLQCASNWGSQSWRIYVRNLSGAPRSNWTWCNISFSGTCWDAERALLHEAEHVTMAVAFHDSQGEANTIMGSVSPWYPNSGWSTHHIQRCDEAAGQLLTGMASPNGPIADCFNNIPGHGAVGLIPALGASSTSISVCLGTTATMWGAFGIRSDYRYQLMSGLPLGGRTVWFDRKPHTSSTWTLNVAAATTTAAGTWSRALSTGSTTTITYDFRPHTAYEPGLDPATGPVIVVTWRRC